MFRIRIAAAVASLGFACASIAGSPDPAADALAEALVSADASSEIPAEDRIYDRLVGTWDVRAIDIRPDGSRHESLGEWHFAYVLEGRAAQDVWIAPARHARTAQTSREFNRYGSTLRYYLPASRTWRVIWINPVSGAMDVLEGRAVADGIDHEGIAADQSRIRWNFRHIDEQSFHWTGERSRDGGRSWTLEAEFFGARRKPHSSS